ncbi:MAG: tetratricopeptide repeat protein [Gammaproteobacteria bacterium]|nr:tetratricopeptide repeat protein [Gammaproteobacteria bacterium]
MNRVLPIVISLLTAASSLALDTSASAAREQARQSYEAFLELAQPDDPRRPGALRRLADMELERAEALLIDGNSDTLARTLFANAVQRYQELLDAFPESTGSDTVHYQMARALEALGDSDGARNVLSTLVRDHPGSEFLEESAFREAETYFSAGRYAQAADAYARVIQWGEQESSQKAFLEQSWYKHGWAMFKLADYQQSQASFLKLMRHMLLVNGTFKPAHLERLTPGEQEMQSDALRAMSLSFSYSNGVSDLQVLLERDRAPGFEHLLYQDLGNLYRREERYNDAAQTFRAYVAKYGQARYAPYMQLAVVSTYEQAGFAEQALGAKEEFARTYALDRDPEHYWASHSREQESDVVTALKLYLGELSRHYHARAQATGELTHRIAAADWYRAWLRSFPDDPESAATHFLLAELLFDGKLFVEAVSAYESTAYDYDEHPRAAEAGYAALLAYKEHAATLTGAGYGEWESRAIDSGLKFASHFKNHQFATAVQVDAAERLFDRHEMERAVLAAQELLAWEPAAPLGEQHTAWLVSGHAWFDQHDYLRAENAYQNALATGQETASQAVVERLAASIYKQAEAHQATGDLEFAATNYLRVATQTPTSALVASAQYEAASVFMELENFSRAAHVLESFRQAFPDHQLAQEVTRNLSVSYQQDGHPEKAAAELMRLAGDPRIDRAGRVAANTQAIALYSASHNTEQLLASYVYLVNELGLPLDEDIDAREKIAGIFLKLGNESQQFVWLESIINTHEQAGASASPRSRTAAAQATLFVAEQAWTPFAKIRLTEPLQENLKLKTSHMETLLNKLGQAAAYGVSPVTTAATFHMAMAYSEMAAALMESERPTGLTAQELEQYEFLLEEQAFPFEEQAIAVHENNTYRIADGIYDGWVRKSFVALGDLMPGRYQKTEKGVSLANSLEE